MKKLTTICFLVIVLICNCHIQASSPIMQLTMEELPLSARNILNANFEVDKILVIQKRESKRLKVEYTVRFKGGKKVVFDTMGNWTSLDCQGDLIPYLLIPSKIRNHIAQRYGPYVHPIAMKRIKNKYQIVLNNHIELVLK